MTGIVRPSLAFGFLLVASLGACLLTTTGMGCAKVQSTVGNNGTGGAAVPSTIPNLASLTINPPSDSVILTTDAAGQIAPAMKTFTVQATLNDNKTTDATGRVTWSVAPRSGSVVGGAVTVTTPGIFTVTATSGIINASAQLTATLSGNKFGDKFNPANASKLDGNASGSVNVAYPLDGAIFPSNFGPVTVQLAKTGGQDIARLAFVGDGLDLKYYGACETGPGSGCYLTLSTAITKLFLAASSQNDVRMTARLGSAAGGTVAESAPLNVAWADVALSGGLYYWTTISPGAVPGYTPPDAVDSGTAVVRYNFNGDMPVPELVWTDRGSPRTNPPFQESPPALMGTDPMGLRPAWGEGRCIGCHAISPNGQLMAFSINGSDASSWAILNIGSTTLNLLDPNASTATTGLDALKRYRKGNFATFTTFGPNSDLMVNMYRGKLTLHRVDPTLAVVKDDLFAAATSELKSDPFWSPNGMHFAFTSYDPKQDTENSRLNGDTKTGGQIWIASADATSPHDDAKIIVARQSGVTSYYPAISHDGSLLVFNKSSCSGPMNPGGYGTGSCDGYDDITASLWLTNPGGKAPVNLARANGGEQNSNSWPRWSPDNGMFRGQKLYWLAFSSRRPYGLQVNSGAGTGAKPQLWFAAILTGDEFSGDSSHPPVWLPDQNLNIATPTGNHVPQWVKFVVPIE